MLLRLGEMALEQRGDAALARDEFDRAWKLQEEISQHPRSGNYSKSDNFRLLSAIAIKRGTAELGLGRPDQARDRFQKALELREAWTKAEPQNVSAKSYTSEAELFLGVAFSHVGDAQNSRLHFTQALQICNELAERFPRDLSFKGDLAMVSSEWGEALARIGQDIEAEGVLNQSLEYSRAALARKPDDAAQRLVTAASSERLAALAHKRGKTSEEDRLWRLALDIRNERADFDVHNVLTQAALALALAHSRQCTEALHKAELLLKASPDRPAVLLPLARAFAACARHSTIDSDRRRARAFAIEAVGSAIRSGYRDRVAVRTDAEFTELLTDPEFKKLVDGITP
jgi:tetratricopeptide (TPR) repeat protein